MFLLSILERLKKSRTNANKFFLNFERRQRKGTLDVETNQALLSLCVFGSNFTYLRSRRRNFRSPVACSVCAVDGSTKPASVQAGGKALLPLQGHLWVVTVLLNWVVNTRSSPTHSFRLVLVSIPVLKSIIICSSNKVTAAQLQCTHRFSDSANRTSNSLGQDSQIQPKTRHPFPKRYIHRCILTALRLKSSLIFFLPKLRSQMDGFSNNVAEKHWSGTNL